MTFLLAFGDANHQTKLVAIGGDGSGIGTTIGLCGESRGSGRPGRQKREPGGAGAGSPAARFKAGHAQRAGDRGVGGAVAEWEDVFAADAIEGRGGGDFGAE